MDSTYLKWSRGNRLSRIGGVAFLEGATPNYSNDYIDLYVPLFEAFYPKEETVVSEAKVNQLLRLIPAATVDVAKNYRIKVEINPKLLDYALVQAPTTITYEDEDTQPVVIAKFYRPFKMEDLDYLVRLQLME